MLLKAEKILSHEAVLLDKNESEILRIIRRELCERFIDEMIAKNLINMELTTELYDDLGMIVKVRATTRVYNPDD